MEQKSSFKAILAQKCPKCHKGKLFTHAIPYSLNSLSEMPESCSECGQVYEPEPGFYTGAMYVNYAFTVILTLLTYFVLEVYLKVSTVMFFSIYGAMLLLLSPFLFRYSRVIYLSMMIKYDGEAIKKHKLLP